MKTSDFLRQHNACPDGARWALSVSSDMSAVWDTMIEQGKHDWLIWTATRPGVFSESILRKLACRFVRETPLRDGGTVWDLLADAGSKRAVEVAEAYADGKATKKELADACQAARAAARIAAYSAAEVAARAAAWAAADAAACTAAYTAVCDAYWVAADVADAAQVRMVAQLGNPFKKRKIK